MENDSNEFNSLFDLGRDIREKLGDPKRAQRVFERALDFSITQFEFCKATLEIGLCMEHQKRYEDALNMYRTVYKELVCESGDKHKYLLAKSLRHQSSVYSTFCRLNHRSFQEKLYFGDKAVELAINAYGYVNTLVPRPPNTVWFSHGVVKALISRQKPKIHATIWLNVEKHDLEYAETQGQSLVDLSVWRSGYLVDKAQVEKSIFSYFSAFWFALTGGAGMRLRQMLLGH